MTFAVTNPRWVRPGMIDVTWEHPDFGVIDYTAIDNSGGTEMQQIWDAVLRGDYGPIAPLEDS